MTNFQTLILKMFRNKKVVLFIVIFVLVVYFVWIRVLYPYFLLSTKADFEKYCKGELKEMSEIYYCGSVMWEKKDHIELEERMNNIKRYCRFKGLKIDDYHNEMVAKLILV